MEVSFTTGRINEIGMETIGTWLIIPEATPIDCISDAARYRAYFDS